MEKSNIISNSEMDLSDSWTVVNSDDSEENVDAEIGETSDSESLEVLEVEQEEPEQNSQEDLKWREQNDHDEYTKDCDDSFLPEDPLIRLAAIQKVRQYVHHPSAYINMWLSAVMVIAIAVTLGLGIGHYLGSKRFARAKDMIHHLKYENQMLEQELADVIMRNKYCENDLHNKVRQLVLELKQFELPGSYCTSYCFQGNVYANLLHGQDEDVCYAEENPLFMNSFEENVVNFTEFPIVQWFSYINDGEQNLGFPFENKHSTNKSNIVSKNNDNTSSDVELLPKLEVINDKIYSNKSQFSFSKLNIQLTYLHSLLKKWNKFHENLKLPASDSKTEYMQNPRHLSVDAHKVVPPVSGTPNKVSSENIKHRLTDLSNGFCRSKINQCVLREEKLQKKDKKCYALTKAQLLCSLLQRSKKKQGNKFLLDKQSVHEKKDKKPKAPLVSFEHNRYKKVEKIKLTQNKKKGSRKDEKVSSNMHTYSTSDSKRMRKKAEAENTSKDVGRKENNHKFKHITRNQNRNKKDKKYYQSQKPTKKQPYHRIHHKGQQPKPITKLLKQNKKNYSKEIFKTKHKRDISWDKNEKKYYEKFSEIKSMNRKNTENFKPCSNDKRCCQFHMNDKKMTENKKYFPHSRYDSTTNDNFEKFSSAENSNRKNTKQSEERYNNGRYCKFHLGNKKVTESKTHYTRPKYGFSEKSYRYKTQNINKKNGSENASCKYSFILHQKDNDFQKYLKDRSKTYEIAVQEMKVLKT